jgi:hypothetical protein
MTERRQRMRRQCSGQSVLVTAFVGREVWQPAIHDISPAGIGIVLSQSVEPGTLVTVALLNQSSSFWHMKVMRVVHATARSNGTWLVGNRFLQTLSEDQFDGLLN